METDPHYRVVEAPSAWDLEVKVKQLLDQGWAPQGGVCAVTRDGGVQLFQAMTCDLLLPVRVAAAEVAAELPVAE